MDPAELKFIIDRSKEIFIALNNPKERSKDEEKVYKFARSSIVADKDLSSGHIISSQDIWARRPGSGEISVSNFNKLIGAKVINKLKKNTQIKWSDIELKN